jgi:predicted PurR-regulated permease PerM
MPAPIASIPSSESEVPDSLETAALQSAARIPERRRDLAPLVMATIAVVFALKWAQGFVIALLIGILIAYTLNPLVVLLERIRIPRVVSTSIVMAGAVCALILGTYSLRGQVLTIFDQLPDAVSKLSTGIASLRQGQASTMQRVQTAAKEIEKAANEAAGAPSAPRQKATHVIVDTPGSKLGNLLWAGSMGVAGSIGQIAMVLFLAYFLLLSGDILKRKLVRVTGPSLSRRKITVRILDDINESIQRYMLMLLASNVLVGLLTWLALDLIGMENSGAWAVAAGMLHLIPYFGPAVTAGVIGMAAYMQFDILSSALLAAGASLVIAMIVGFFGVTWLTGRSARMNTAAVFTSLLFWTWLWGVWGMLLSVPIIVIVKVVAQHVEQLDSIAELLSD